MQLNSKNSLTAFELSKNQEMMLAYPQKIPGYLKVTKDKDYENYIGL